MLKFHQNETCEGMIQYLEARTSTRRSDVVVRDRGNQTSVDARVEMTFRLSDQLYAIEHTGIEPFDGFMEHQNRAPELFEPLATAITVALKDVLVPGTLFEMHIPFDAFLNRPMSEVRAMHGPLAEWASATAPSLPIRRYGDYRGTPVTAQLPGLPFSVTLVRFVGMGMPGRFQLRHSTSGSEEPRAVRIERACNKKFPKLASWKRSNNARTILVLEDNDIQLTNQGNVAGAFLPIASSRADKPDETYLVETHTSPWYVWPLLVGDLTYFDLPTSQGHLTCFEMDQMGALLRSSKVAV